MAPVSAALGRGSQAEKGRGGEPAGDGHPCPGAWAASRSRRITNGAQVGSASLHTSARKIRQKLSSQTARVLISFSRKNKTTGQRLPATLSADFLCEPWEVSTVLAAAAKGSPGTWSLPAMPKQDREPSRWLLSARGRPGVGSPSVYQLIPPRGARIGAAGGNQLKNGSMKYVSTPRSMSSVAGIQHPVHF